MKPDTSKLASLGHSLYQVTVRRPVAIIMVVCLVVVFGLVSYERLALTLMPDISYPTITVRTEYGGAAPEEVETVISRPTEQALGVVNHLVRISSVSRAELSDVILEFSWGTDMSAAAQDVREKLERVHRPEDVERPLILRYDPTLDPIMRLAVWGDRDMFELRRIAEDQVKRALDGMEGVAAVKVRGGLEEEILVEVKEDMLAELKMDISKVVNRLRAENINLSGGQLREGLTEYMVRTLNEFKSMEEIGDLVIKDSDGVPIRLKDIARVSSTHKEREVITRIEGKESVEIEVYKEGDANIVDVAQAVRDKLFGTEQQQAFVARQKAAAKDTAKKVKKSERRSPRQLALANFVSNQIPPGGKLDILTDQSTFIRASLREVASAAFLGGIMAVIILYLFLRRLSHTLIVAVAIPVSIIATFAGMYLGGVSLNIMSLGGLALGVGMMVDNSIVVLESIFRCREDGDDIMTAAVRGVGEVGGAVTASTMTTIAVFLPIVFVEGIAGQVFGDLSLAVVFSLLASLAVALWFIPMLASRRISPDAAGSDLIKRLSGAHILHLWTVESAQKQVESLGTETSVSGKARVLGALALYMPVLPIEIIGRAIALAATAIVVLLRAVLAVVAPLLWPIVAPIRRFAFKCDTPYATAIGTWFKNSEWWRFYWLIGRVWPPLLSFNSPESLREGVSDAANWMWQGRWWHRALRFIPGVIRMILVHVRFAAQAILEPTGKLVIITFLLAGLVIMGILAILGMILMPLFMLLSAVFEVAYGWVAALYPRMIRWALSHDKGDNRLYVIGSAFALFALTVFLLLPRVGRELIPQVHQGEFYVDVALPVGTPIDATSRVVSRIEGFARATSGVARVAARVGAEKSATTSSDEGENTGRITVVLDPVSDLVGTEARIMAELRAKLHAVANVEATMSLPTLFSFKTPVEVEIKGYNLTELRRLSTKVRDRLTVIEGFEDVESSIQAGNPEVLIAYDRKRLSDMGLTPLTVANLIRTKVRGSVATTFRREATSYAEERRIDIRVQIDEKDKRFVGDLRKLIINPGQPVAIPLSSVADVKIVEGPSEIRRIAQQRAAVVSANLKDLDLGTATEAIYGTLNEMKWPSEFSYLVGGQNQEMQTSLQSLYFALMLAVFLVYVVMASQFESFLHPFVILFSIPLALIGVVVVLWAFHIPLGVMVFLGLIILAGIVVNNAIVLVDYVNRLRRDGLPKDEALVRAGEIRLRPILMTTMTTVLGLTPMAIGLGEGAEIRTPMAIAVIAGLISSTLLTLLVVPTIYSVLDRSTD
jgi:multidrug efflux pump subunit AcrB